MSSIRGRVRFLLPPWWVGGLKTRSQASAHDEVEEI
jgi:hypothetical protein